MQKGAIGDLLARYPSVATRPGGSATEIAAVEDRLRIRLPDQLRRFIGETDGASVHVTLRSGDVVREASPLVMSLSEILAANTSSPPAVSGLLLFAWAGVDGIAFGHEYDRDGNPGDRVIAWHPLEGRKEVVATSFRTWLVAWLSGALTL